MMQCSLVFADVTTEPHLGKSAAYAQALVLRLQDAGLPCATFAEGSGNWRWQLSLEQLASSVAERLLKMTEIYGRA